MSGKIPLGMAINIWQVDWTTALPNLHGQYIGHFDQQIQDYTHTSEAMFGYISANFTITLKDTEINDWLQRGLSRHVEVYDPSGTECWEGFVDTMTFNISGYSLTIGPLSDICNQAYMTYTSLDTTKTIPEPGSGAVTTIVQNYYSQERYGYWERAITGGLLDNTAAMDFEANQLCSMYIELASWPKASKQWNVSGSSVPTLQIECSGYYKRLAYMYDNWAVPTVSYAASDKISDVLSYDLNGIFNPVTNADIDANPILEQENDRDDRLALDVIKEIVAKGDLFFNRWLFDVYNGVHVSYHQQVAEISYYQQLRDPAQRISTATGDTIHPALIRPGKWLMFTDFDLSSDQWDYNVNLPIIPMSYNGWPTWDMRRMFIEAVTFTAPDQLDLSSGLAWKLSQMIEQKGLGGV